MFRVYFSMILLLFTLTSHIAQAEEKIIAYIKTAENEAEIITGNTSRKAEPGAPIHLGDILKTGENSSLGLIFKDNTIMSIGHKSEIKVDEYLYAPAQEELKLVASITKGTLYYVSGIIAKLKPEAVSIKTPTATLGVKGTRFVVKVSEDDNEDWYHV